MRSYRDSVTLSVRTSPETRTATCHEGCTTRQPPWAEDQQEKKDYLLLTTALSPVSAPHAQARTCTATVGPETRTQPQPQPHISPACWRNLVMSSSVFSICCSGLLSPSSALAAAHAASAPGVAWKNNFGGCVQAVGATQMRTSERESG
eukprot:826604-Rhodomonas_salina.2